MFLSRFFVEGMVVERRDSCGGRYAPEPPVAKPCSCGVTNWGDSAPFTGLCCCSAVL